MIFQEIERPEPQDLSEVEGAGPFTTRSRVMHTDGLKVFRLVGDERQDLGRPDELEIFEAALVDAGEGVVIVAGSIMIRMPTDRAYRLAQDLIYAADCYALKASNPLATTKDDMNEYLDANLSELHADISKAIN